MNAWIPVVAAFGVVAGMLSFLAYCGAQFDAEEMKVRGHGGKSS